MTVGFDPTSWATSGVGAVTRSTRSIICSRRAARSESRESPRLTSDAVASAETLRIFIGTDESQIVAHQVLAHSIRAHASIPVEIRPMFDDEAPTPTSDALGPRTRFSFTRFLIPELAGYAGRALYVDADMVVFGDV